tara:strand:+ start:1969 stop:2214 length:246 start_codon:yes stop_codon:yes gene_type:complete
MAHNRFFIVNSDDTNLSSIIDLVVQTGQKQRDNFAKTKLAVKLHEGDHEDHEVLDPYQEYSYSEIIIALDNDEWRVNPFTE